MTFNMMKVKADVDLKELEKYGFNYVEWRYNHEYGFFPKLYVKDMYKDNRCLHKVNIIINTEDRIVDIRNGKDFSLLVSKQSIKKYLSDLIKADLIEEI